MRRAPSSIALLALAIAGASFVALVAGLADAAPRDRRFFSARHGVGVDAPPGWTISQHTGYPSILVLLLHPNGSRISISAAPTTAADARALADQNRRALEAQHLTIGKVGPGPRGGVLIEARGGPHPDEMRQVYLVRPLPDGTRQAVVITLVTRADTLAAALPGFDAATANLSLETPTGKDGEADAGARPAGPNAGASAAERSADETHR
jgi:hypothetical protein